MNLNRNYFLSIIVATLSITASLSIFLEGDVQEKWGGELLGPNREIAHRMLLQNFPDPEDAAERETDILIVGAGVSGLAAARRLKNENIDDFIVLEIEKTTGGNSASGEHAGVSYPWGAHYLPIPNTENTSMLNFLEELGVITSYQNGIPVYKEDFVCYEPRERIFKDGKWYTGLVPEALLSSVDQDQMNRFYQLIHHYRFAKGKDNRFAFDIPIKNSSQDSEFRDLDKMSFKKFINDQNLDSPYLHKLMDHCCLDDFGSVSSEVSAWAGMHYFCSRRGQGFELGEHAVLTWPEGNSWLTKRMSSHLKDHIESDQCVFSISENNNMIVSLIFDSKKNRTFRIKSKLVIFSAPQFVAAKIVSGYASQRKAQLKNLVYKPWLVANIHLKDPPSSFQPYWDNVPYQGRSLGYIFSGHQQLKTYHSRMTLSLYWPWNHLPDKEARIDLMSRKAPELKTIALNEWLTIHPELEDYVDSCDLWVWGHGMINPEVNFMWHSQREKLSQAFGRILFAHSDLSGISIFEEAFHQGERAAQDVIEMKNKKII